MLKNITLALAATALFAAPAVSAQERDTRTTGVSVADLDLSTEEGRRALDQRISNAAREVCGMNEREVGSNIASRESRRCFQDAKRQMQQHFAQRIENESRGG